MDVHFPARSIYIKRKALREGGGKGLVEMTSAVATQDDV